MCCSPWGHKESDMTEQLNNNNPTFEKLPWIPVRQRGGLGGGKEVQEGGDICIHRAHSHCHTAETNTAL